MFSKLLANEGFNKFAGIAKSFMGWGNLKGIGRGIQRASESMAAARKGGYIGGVGKQMLESDLQGVGRRMGGWASASGFRGAKRAGAVAARVGGVGIGAGAAADFLNPWGLGWGD